MTIYYMFRTTSYQIFSTDQIYINADLACDERTHWLFRSLLNTLGMPGETRTYPGSIVYSVNNNVTELNPIELEML